jgi:hypothetical protein
VTDRPGLTDELTTLAHTDSVVAKAAASLARVYESAQARGDVPRVRFRKSTADRPCLAVPIGVVRRCFCGRPALPGELDCAEHDDPPEVTR